MEENYYGFDYWRAGQTLAHHGIKGQKWGVRRYQNSDGSLTAAGRKRYKSTDKNAVREMMKEVVKVNGGKKGYKYAYSRQRNCAFCSISYDLRRRGLDVQAQQAPRGVTDDAIFAAYKNPKNVRKFAQRSAEDKNMNEGLSKTEYDELVKNIVRDGTSRGILACEWKSFSKQGSPNGGHAMSYEVKDNEFYLIDAQMGKVMSGKQAYDHIKHGMNVYSFRTDNIKPAAEMQQLYSENVSGIKTNTAKKAESITGNIFKATGFAGAGATAVGAMVPTAAPVTVIAGLGLTGISLVNRYASIGFGIAAQSKEIRTGKDIIKKWKETGAYYKYNYKKDPDNIGVSKIYGD